MGTATRSARVFVRSFPDSTLLWNSGERKCRAPSGNVSSSSLDRTSICLEADSRSVCVTVINLDLYAYCGRFVLTTNSKELFDRAIVI
ncbi:hypothetical protein ALC62_02191 [Cyphomyrmex costatus]|uniref:Uncharacterized protein n=1 Tax=Cyphomyrmex costatus TaxID=456900 RepID=A0A195D1M6_9HYME|nr:hypothetical protein ALC62_02191 [Cyphomyrmex costatus]